MEGEKAFCSLCLQRLGMEPSLQSGVPRPLLPAAYKWARLPTRQLPQHSFVFSCSKLTLRHICSPPGRHIFTSQMLSLSLMYTYMHLRGSHPDSVYMLRAPHPPNTYIHTNAHTGSLADPWVQGGREPGGYS